MQHLLPLLPLLLLLQLQHRPLHPQRLLRLHLLLRQYLLTVSLYLLRCPVPFWM